MVLPLRRGHVHESAMVLNDYYGRHTMTCKLLSVKLPLHKQLSVDLQTPNPILW
jgi:hypothetical protein